MTKNIVGQQIIAVRPMSDTEMEEEGWEGVRPIVIVLENGYKIFPSRDEEGNDAGCLFGEFEGKTYYVGEDE